MADAHFEDTLIPFFVQNRPAAKGAVIVNSVAQAKRVVERLTEALDCMGWKLAKTWVYKPHPAAKLL